MIRTSKYESDTTWYHGMARFVVFLPSVACGRGDGDGDADADGDGSRWALESWRGLPVTTVLYCVTSFLVGAVSARSCYVSGRAFAYPLRPKYHSRHGYSCSKLFHFAGKINSSRTA